MTAWKVLIADGLEQNGLHILRETATADDCRGISAGELQRALSEYDALIVRSRTDVTASLLEGAPELKVVGRAGVGVDNIDLDAARLRGVIVVNAPLSTSQAVAELTLGMIFAMARAIPRLDAAMKTGQWLKKEASGSEVYGKTLGVIGMGNIGARLARCAAALGMSVLGYDRLLNDGAIRNRGAQPAPLHSLYARSDYVSLHVPLTPETRGMLDQAALDQMKSGVRLVCTARGGLIDENALLAALESGKVAGAALDVFAQEPPGLTSLTVHPNVIATPHIGAQTGEAQQRAAEDIAREVLAALEGAPLRWRVA